MNSVQEQDLFKRLVAALEPWLDHVVIIGGWAHQLYRLHPHAQELTYSPLTTLDADVAVPADLPAREQDIRARLLRREKFSNRRPASGVFRGRITMRSR